MNITKNADKKNLAATLAEMDQQVVAQRGEVSWTRAELHDLFRRVANKTHWKNPINHLVVLADERDIAGMEEAIVFFTGSVPEIVPTGKANQYRVRAAGYFAVIGS